MQSILAAIFREWRAIPQAPVASVAEQAGMFGEK
jgi:hypothetical protein